MPHQVLTGKADFDNALNNNSGKYVLINLYKGEMNPQSEAMADRFSETAVSYKVDVGANPMAQKGFKVDKTPTVLVFKDGSEVQRVEEPDMEKMGPVFKLLS